MRCARTPETTPATSPAVPPNTVVVELPDVVVPTSSTVPTTMVINPDGTTMIGVVTSMIEKATSKVIKGVGSGPWIVPSLLD